MIRKINTEKHEYIFTCYVYDNSRSWGHDCILNRDGYQIGHNRIRYYNRTWESYQFQSVMMGLIYDLIEQEKQTALNDWKERTGRKRSTKKEKEKIYSESQQVQELINVYNQL